MASWHDWGCWIGAGLLGLAAMWLLTSAFLGVGLFRRRTRRLRRCPKCWYDMSGAPTPTPEAPATCPECGRQVLREQHLRRIRRRVWLAIPAALFIAVGANLALVPSRPDKGWTRWVPTTVLVEVARPFRASVASPSAFSAGALANSDSDELLLASYKRLGSMWTWQRRRLLGSKAVPHAARLRDMVWVREKWPEGTPIRVHLDAPLPSAMFDIVVNTELSVSDQVAGPFQSEYGGYCLWPISSNPDVESAPRSIGRHSILASVQTSGSIQLPSPPTAGVPTVSAMLRAGALMYEGPSVWSRATKRLSVEIVPSLDDAITPVSSPDLSRLMAESVRVSVAQISSRAFSGVLVDVTFESPHWPESVARTCTVSVSCGEDVVRLEYLTDLGREEDTRQLWASTANEAFVRAYRRAREGEPDAWDGWVLNIEGDGKQALVATRAPSYWSGSISVPFRPELRPDLGTRLRQAVSEHN